MSADTPCKISRLELGVLSTAEAIGEVRRAVEAYAGQCGLDEKAVADMGLCVNEAMANIIRHAYKDATDGRIEIVAQQQAGKLCISLRDWGTGVNPAALPPKPYDPAEPGGVGLICIRTLMDKVQYIPQTDGMLLVMWKDGRVRP